MYDFVFLSFFADEEFAKRLQEEEDKQGQKSATASPAKQQAKKMRKVDIDTRFNKDQTAQLFSPKSAWNKPGKWLSF